MAGPVSQDGHAVEQSGRLYQSLTRCSVYRAVLELTLDELGSCGPWGAVSGAEQGQVRCSRRRAWDNMVFLPQIRREEEGRIPRWKWVDHIEQVGKR